MARRNVRKIRCGNTPIPPQEVYTPVPYIANADGGNSTSSTSSTSSKDTPWWNITDKLADTAVKLYDGIIDPIFFGSKAGRYQGDYTFTKQKDNTATYLIIGGVIIVALVMILKYVKK